MHLWQLCLLHNWVLAWTTSQIWQEWSTEQFCQHTNSHNCINHSRYRPQLWTALVTWYTNCKQACIENIAKLLTRLGKTYMLWIYWPDCRTQQCTTTITVTIITSNTYLRSSIVKTNATIGLVFMNRHSQSDVLANHYTRNGPANVCTLESPNVP